MIASKTAVYLEYSPIPIPSAELSTRCSTNPKQVCKVKVNNCELVYLLFYFLKFNISIPLFGKPPSDSSSAFSADADTVLALLREVETNKDVNVSRSLFELHQISGLPTGRVVVLYILPATQRIKTLNNQTVNHLYISHMWKFEVRLLDSWRVIFDFKS